MDDWKRWTLHFFLGSQQVQGRGLFTHWGPHDHSHGVLTKGTCDPRWVVWGLCEAHSVSWDKIMGDHTQTHN